MTRVSLICGSHLKCGINSNANPLIIVILPESTWCPKKHHQNFRNIAIWNFPVNDAAAGEQQKTICATLLLYTDIKLKVEFREPCRGFDFHKPTTIILALTTKPCPHK